MSNVPTSYAEALGVFTYRRTARTITRGVKLANNTHLTYEDCLDTPTWFGVRLHKTNVVTFHSDGRIELDTGGWKTVTTKQRMNSALGRYGGSSSPVGLIISWSIYQKNHAWYVTKQTRKDGNLIGPPLDFVYEDGITLHSNGMVTGEGG